MLHAGARLAESSLVRPLQDALLDAAGCATRCRPGVSRIVRGRFAPQSYTGTATSAASS